MIKYVEYDFDRVGEGSAPGYVLSMVKYGQNMVKYTYFSKYGPNMVKYGKNIYLRGNPTSLEGKPHQTPQSTIIAFL